MADLLSTGVSGLLAFQRALDTTSHNISNVSTDGYSRQRVEIGTRPAQAYGNGWVGQGASVNTTTRIYDQFVAAQTRASSSNLEHLDIYASNAETLNNMFGDSANGLSPTLQKFVNAFQSVANSPASVPARQVLLSEANTLQQRLQFFDSRLDQMGNEINSRIKGEVAEVNTLSQGIARLNNEITAGIARTGGQPPNDLLDQRDQLLDQLAQKISVNVVPQDGGAVNVFVGSGQPLVLGANTNQLTTIQDPYDSTQLTVALQTPGSSVDISRNVTGGSLGGLLAFRGEQLDPARNALGRIAVALSDVVNEQHHEGMDLSGALGGDFFAVGDAEVLDNSLNTGTGTVAAARADVGALTGRDYVLEMTGSGWQLRDSINGTAVPMTGTGTAADPFVADGLEIEVGGAADVGDRFLIRPTRGAITDMSVLITDPSKVAAAAPIRAAAVSGNSGSGTISAGEVLDSTNAQLRSPVTIQFLTATTYSINGAGSFAYTGGGNIDVNGWRVQISGAPAAGDSFTVRDNTSGTGDNRNALLLSDALKSNVLNGGTTSLGSAVGEFVGGIGVATRQAQVNRDAQNVVYEESLATKESVSGVNLDEEAANLLKYQQAYQAAAQLIRVADTMFQTLLAATER
ncbi:MAG TPA: flagellar hook-associated protein FlgK [Steroidobacteraceae bacterium]|nr:flagellar hook-associated protein FlgK [Steroidobacteraceae bacterium]